jgi:hypothetical protein
MGKKLAIVGSRDWPHPSWVMALVMECQPSTTVVSGGARGVDSVAVAAAKGRGLKTIEFPADWSRGRGAGYERNHKIVEAADYVVAFWDGHSPGTRHTIRIALAQGKLYWVVTPERRYTAQEWLATKWGREDQSYHGGGNRGEPMERVGT